MALITQTIDKLGQSHSSL